MESTFGVESPAFVAVRAVLSMATVGLLGSLALRWAVLLRYVGPDSMELREAVDRRLGRWVARLAAVAILGTLARFAAQHAAVFGTDGDVTVQSLSALIFRSAWGRSWWLAFLASLVIAGLAPRLRGASRGPWIGAACAILVFAIAQPLSGHPAAAHNPWLATAVQSLHLVGAGGWIGSLALLTAVAIPVARTLPAELPGDSDVRVAELIRAFSPTALVFASALGLTGLFTAWNNLGGLAPLWESPYGRTLLLKLALLSVAAGTGAYNWRRVLPHLGTPEASARLRRSSLVELAAAMMVLVVTAVLVATPMPWE
ncbi:MAG: hypothetical protein C0503_01055 [Gemmatimonas sp.]|nr:hypothetical protein [Gemmatimonas sp.]